MRLIDADALEKEGWSLHRTIRVDKYSSEYQTKSLKQILTIEPERKMGQWKLIDNQDGFPNWICSECGGSGRGDYLFCPWCQAKMKVRYE